MDRGRDRSAGHGNGSTQFTRRSLPLTVYASTPLCVGSRTGSTSPRSPTDILSALISLPKHLARCGHTREFYRFDNGLPNDLCHLRRRYSGRCTVGVLGRTIPSMTPVGVTACVVKDTLIGRAFYHLTSFGINKSRVYVTKPRCRPPRERADQPAGIKTMVTDRVFVHTGAYGHPVAVSPLAIPNHWENASHDLQARCG